MFNIEIRVTKSFSETFIFWELRIGDRCFARILMRPRPDKRAVKDLISWIRFSIRTYIK